MHVVSPLRLGRAIPRDRERPDVSVGLVVALAWALASVALLACRVGVDAMILGESDTIDVAMWLVALAYLASLSRAIRMLSSSGHARSRMIEILEVVREYLADEEPTDPVAA